MTRTAMLLNSAVISVWSTGKSGWEAEKVAGRWEG